MSLGVLNNISAMYAENNLNSTDSSLQTVLTQLSSGSRINSGADDAAGLSLADGLSANSAALTQSSTNASEGVGLLQVADGALSQVTSLLNRAVTLATEAANGTLNTAQDSAANSEYQSILDEISNIGSTTTYNGQTVFGGTFTIFTGDGTTGGGFSDALTLSTLASDEVGDATGSAGLTYTSGAGTATSTLTYTPAATAGTDYEDLATTDLTDQSDAETALNDVYAAVQDVAAERGYTGAQINALNAVSDVESTEQVNVTSAENSITATDYASATSNLSKYEVLDQTGISALAQANSTEQLVTKLLQ
ncbi:flagellin [Silvibacterium dinghuense]|uniref:Flagellin n=1 Tax=Silvibacterium dinghuense TaxID=1560006 RepID=A0A4Q1SDH0_9BACT|nr:flagellin [Silvibacterium dinghuense]RXS95272.1 flagellin [Silvibacterium dinghuense]GGH12015.1 flagellin [Silvibacterium dinghuense]